MLWSEWTFDPEKPLVRMNLWSRKAFGPNEPLIERMLWSEWTFDREKPVVRMNIWLKKAISPNEPLLGDKLRSKNEHLIEKKSLARMNVWSRETFGLNEPLMKTHLKAFPPLETNIRESGQMPEFHLLESHLPETPFARNADCQKLCLPDRNRESWKNLKNSQLNSDTT